MGTYPVPAGMTESAFKSGFMGGLFGGSVFIDDNLTVDSSDDTKGGIFAKETIVLVQGTGPRTATKRREEKAGGGDDLFMYDEYAYGIRHSNGLYEIYSDVAAPTS